MVDMRRMPERRLLLFSGEMRKVNVQVLHRQAGQLGAALQGLREKLEDAGCLPRLNSDRRRTKVAAPSHRLIRAIPKEPVARCQGSK